MRWAGEGKFEIRSPKFETNSNDEERSSYGEKGVPHRKSRILARPAISDHRKSARETVKTVNQKLVREAHPAEAGC